MIFHFSCFSLAGDSVKFRFRGMAILGDTAVRGMTTPENIAQSNLRAPLTKPRTTAMHAPANSFAGIGADGVLPRPSGAPEL